MDGENRKTLKLNGDEKISIKKINDLTPGGTLPCEIEYANGEKKTITLKSRIDTQNELNYFNNGGILHFVLRNLNK